MLQRQGGGFYHWWLSTFKLLTHVVFRRNQILKAAAGADGQSTQRFSRRENRTTPLLDQRFLESHLPHPSIAWVGRVLGVKEMECKGTISPGIVVLYYLQAGLCGWYRERQPAHTAHVHRADQGFRFRTHTSCKALLCRSLRDLD